jgi:UDP-N-acetylglucosamine--N-acetylmuramyl-(pentapeptide) pyrophosphoryl-undecaprenol N-acetylglucosamine transferase
MTKDEGCFRPSSFVLRPWRYPVRLLITGGGTGGHVTPAIAVAAAFSDLLPSSDADILAGRGLQPLYIGSATGVERDLVRSAGIPFWGIPAGPLRGQSPPRTAQNLLKLLRGFVLALREVGRFQPDAALATGGYVCAPVVLAARFLRVPVVIYLPDVRPGWAIAALSRLATCTAVTSERSRDYLPGRRVVVTGYPVRPEIGRARREDGLAYFGLRADLPVLLIMGGSQGAHSINVAVQERASEFLQVCQLIHISGVRDEVEVLAGRAALPESLQARYVLRSYLGSDLALAMAAADLVVARAGASVMGEFPAAGLPAVLVPYPYAGAHQRLNAEALEAAGAAVVLDNADLPRLYDTVARLFADRATLTAMAGRARALARPDAAPAIARLLLEAAGLVESPTSTAAAAASGHAVPASPPALTP